MTATFDTASKQLSWKGSVTGLSGPATAAHFHSAESGKNGAVVVPIAGADKGSFEGSATLTDAQAEELMAGKWYVNIHMLCVAPVQVLWSASLVLVIEVTPWRVRMAPPPFSFPAAASAA